MASVKMWIGQLLNPGRKESGQHTESLSAEEHYCARCHVLTRERRCPKCGSKQLQIPLANDFCFLTEKELLWSSAMEELLRDHEIPFVTENALGGLTSKLGTYQERVRFYVPYVKWKKAKMLETEFFSQSFTEE